MPLKDVNEGTLCTLAFCHIIPTIAIIRHTYLREEVAVGPGFLKPIFYRIKDFSGRGLL